MSLFFLQDILMMVGALLISCGASCQASFECLDNDLEQRPTDVAEQKLDRRNFSWYDEQSGKVVDIKNEQPQPAKTLNRGNIARYQPKQKAPAANAAAPRPVNQAWSTVFSAGAWVLIVWWQLPSVAL